MSQLLRREITSLPGTLSLYRRALLRKPAAGRSLPAIEVHMRNQRPDPARVEAFNKVCSFVTSRELAPIYPHVMAFPLHMELMVDEGFPFPLLGLVHISNSITRHRALRIDELLDIRCRFGELEAHDKGTAFSIVTEAHAGGKKVWESTSTMLHRHPVDGGAERKGETAGDEDLSGATRETWRIAGDTGRQYGRASGDMNPIHLWPLTAKAFGFKRHIVHGMWTKSHAVASLMPQIGNRPFTVAVGFKLPIFLPASVTFLQRATPGGIRFDVRDRDGVKPHLKGAVQLLD